MKKLLISITISALFLSLSSMANGFNEKLTNDFSGMNLTVDTGQTLGMDVFDASNLRISGYNIGEPITMTLMSTGSTFGSTIFFYKADSHDDQCTLVIQGDANKVNVNVSSTKNLDCHLTQHQYNNNTLSFTMSVHDKI